MLNNFREHIIFEKRFSEHTCLAYLKDIEQFLEFAGIKSQEELSEVDERLVRAWVVSLIDEGLENSSVNRKLSTLRTFFKWNLREGLIEKSPVKTLKGPKTAKKLPSFAQQKEVSDEKINDLFTSDFEGVRDRLMFEIFYQTGIRSSELVNLKDHDVSERTIKVLGKRSKERIIPVSSALSQEIEAYRKLRSDLSVEHPHFFVLNTGKKLYPKFVFRKINKYLGIATNLEKKSPHVLRHTFATHMLNNGAGLEVLKELLGHASLAATQVYTHNSFAELTKIYSQTHPRGRKT